MYMHNIPKLSPGKQSCKSPYVIFIFDEKSISRVEHRAMISFRHTTSLLIRLISVATIISMALCPNGLSYLRLVLRTVRVVVTGECVRRTRSRLARSRDLDRDLDDIVLYFRTTEKVLSILNARIVVLPWTGNPNQEILKMPFL